MPHPPTQTPPGTLGPVVLAGGHRLNVERRDSADVLEIAGADGRLRIEIVVTEDGPVIRLDGANLRIHASGSLSLDAETLALRGREGVSLASGGDLSISAEGDLRTEARSQEVVARRGDVAVQANDDVTLDGERIRMNC